MPTWDEIVADVHAEGGQEEAPLSWDTMVADAAGEWEQTRQRTLAHRAEDDARARADGTYAEMRPLSDEAAAEGTRNAVIQDEGVKGYIRTMPVVHQISEGVSSGMMAFSQQLAQVAGWLGHEPSQQIADEIAQQRATMRDEVSIMSKDDFMGSELDLGYLGKVNASDTLEGISELLPQMLGFRGTGAIMTGGGMKTELAQRLAPLVWGTYMGSVEAEQQAQQGGLEGTDKAKYVFLQGLSEGLLSAIMPQGMERIGPFKNMTAAQITKEGFSEAIEENLQGATSAFIDWVMLPENSNKPLGEAAMEWLQTVGQTTAVAFGGGTLPGTAAHIFEQSMQEEQRQRPPRNRDEALAQAMEIIAEQGQELSGDSGQLNQDPAIEEPRSAPSAAPEASITEQPAGAEPVGESEPLSETQPLPAEEAPPAEEVAKPAGLERGQAVQVMHGKFKGQRGTVTLLRPGGRAVIELESGETLGARGGIGQERLRPVLDNGIDEVGDTGALRPAGSEQLAEQDTGGRLIGMDPRLAETKEKAAQSPAVKEATAQKYTGQKLDDVGPVLYREMHPDDAERFLNDLAISQRPYGDGGPTHWANKSELAIGQGTNKGVVLEMDNRGFVGQKVKKPGMIGDNAEVTIAHNQVDERKDAIRAAFVSDNVPARSKRMIAAFMRRRGWKQQSVEGGIRYTRPDIAEAQEASPEPSDSSAFEPGQRVQFSRGRRKGQTAEVIEVRDDGRLVLRDEKGKVHGKKNGTDPGIVEAASEAGPALALDWKIESYELESAKDPAEVGQTRWSAKLFNAAHGAGHSGFKSRAEAEAWAAKKEASIEAEKKRARARKAKEKQAEAAKPAEAPKWQIRDDESPQPTAEQRKQLAQLYERPDERLAMLEEHANQVAEAIDGAQVKLGPIKKQRRVVEKSNDDYDGDVLQVRDVYRGTIMINGVDQVQETIDRITEVFGGISRLKNRFEKPTPEGYRDVMMNVQLDGVTMELQINVPRMLEAKKNAHPFYEEARRRDISQEVRDEAIRRQVEIYAEAWEELTAATARSHSSGETDEFSTQTRSAKEGRAGLTVPLTDSMIGSEPSAGKTTGKSSSGSTKNLAPGKSAEEIITTSDDSSISEVTPNPTEKPGDSGPSPMALKAAKRLRQAAEKTLAKAEEEQGQERLANTRRRAEMAASAIGKAMASESRARTGMKIADALEAGEAQELEQVSVMQDIQAMQTVLSRSRWGRLSYAEAERMRHEPFSLEDVEAIRDEDARSLVNTTHVKTMLDGLKGRKGLPEIRSQIDTMPTVNDWHRVENLEQTKALEQLMKLARASSDREVKSAASYAGEDVRAAKRRIRLGINDAESAKQVLRVFVEYQDGVSKEALAKQAQIRRDQELRNSDIPGFFPTPRPLVDAMIEKAAIEPGMRVLEPSAGKGDIVEALQEMGADVEAVEINQTLRGMLEEQGAKLVGDDFLQLQLPAAGYGDIYRAPDGVTGAMHGGRIGSDRVQLRGEDGQQLGHYSRGELELVERRGVSAGYDRVIMNPPFEKGQDREHVMHAYGLLKPGGRLVAIMSKGPFNREQKADEAFRAWFEEVGGQVEDNQAGAFAGADAFKQTGVSTVTVVIDKAEDQAQPAEPTEQAPPQEPAPEPMPFADDIPYETAMRAHSGTSMVPEKRAVQERQGYNDHLVEVQERLRKAATRYGLGEAEANAEFQEYRRGYRTRYLAKLGADSRTLSAMITGPANFPTRRNQKRLDTAHKRLGELVDYPEWAMKKALKNLRANATPEAEERLEVNRLTRKIDSDIEVLAGIESKEGRWRGFDPRAFKNSVATALSTSIRNGNVAAVEQALAHMEARQAELLKRPVLTKRHKVYAELEAAKVQQQQEAEQPVRLEDRTLATYDGAQVVNDAAADRVRIYMDEKPGEEVRKALRGAGWKWSPKAEAWQRKATSNAEASALRIMDEHFERSTDEDAYKDYSPERVPGQEDMFEDGEQLPDEDSAAKRREQAFAKRLQLKIDKAIKHRTDTIRDLHERMSRVRDQETLEDLDQLLGRYEEVDPIALEEDMRKHPAHYLEGPNKNMDPVHVFRKRFTDPPQFSRAAVAPITGGDPKSFKLQASLQELETRLNRAADGAGPTFDVDKGDKGDHGGWYDQQAKRISAKYHNDLDVVSHETGHWLADHYQLLAEGVLNDAMRAELASLGRNATTDKAKMVSEGLGEWAYSYIVNPEHVQQVAPNATAFLLEVMDSRVRKVLDWYSNQVRTFAGLKAVEKFQATMEGTAAEAKRQSSLTHRAVQTVMGWMGIDTNTSEGRRGRVRWWNMGNASWLARLKFHLTNTAAPMEEQYLLALKMVGVDESKLGADVDWRMLRKRMLGMSDRIGHMMLNGLEDTHGNLVLDDGQKMHLGWLTEPSQKGRNPEQAAAWIDEALAFGAAERVVELANRLRDELHEEVEAYAEKLRSQIVDEGQAVADRRGRAWATPEALVEQKIQRYRQLKENLLAKRLARLTGAGGGLFSSEAEARKAKVELSRRKDAADIVEFLRRYRAWASFNLDYAVQTERLSPDQRAAIERSNEYYIDFHRVFAEEDAPSGPEQAIYGSSRTMQNPLISLIHATWFAVQGGEQNRLMHTFTAPLRSRGGPEALSRIGKTVSEESALEALQKHNGYFDDGSGRAKRVYSMKRLVDEVHPETEKVRKVAKTEWWVFDPATEATLEASRAMERPGLVMKFFQMLNNVQRTMITSSPNFALRQFVRDPMENTLNSVVGVRFADAVKAYTNGELDGRTIDDLFHASGAGMAGWHAKGRDAIMRQVMGELKKTAGGNGVMAVPATAFRWYKGLLEASEAKARQIVMVSAYDKAIKEGKSQEQARLIASAEARNVIDFAETGYALGQVNRVILFLNAQVQGYVALTRNVRLGVRAMRDGKHQLARQHLGLAGIRMAYFAALAAGLRLLTLATAADKDEEDEYLQQSPWVKDFNFTGKIAGQRVALAKPYEWGWFSGGVERLVDYAWMKQHGNETDAAKAFDGYSNSFWGMMNPFGKSTFAMSAGPIIEAALNYDTFRGRHIVSPFEEDKDLDKRKGTERASAVGQVLQDGLQIDARKIDFLIRAYGGGWGRMATSESGDRLLTNSVGFTWTRPTWHSRDVEWVLEEARGDGLIRDKRIQVLYKRLYRVYEADSAAERDKAAAEAREYARRLRDLMERNGGSLPKR